MAHLVRWPGEMGEFLSAVLYAPRLQQQLTSQAERYGLRTKSGRTGGVKVEAALRPASRLAATADARRMALVVY